MRILYIEDDPDTALLVRRTLERAGFRVELVDDGERGLEVAAGNPPGLLLVDFDLPGIDGLEVLNRAGRSADALPVVMLTGAGNERLAVEAMKRGARDYLVKDREGLYIQMLPEVVGRIQREEALRRDKAEAEALVSVSLGAIDEALLTLDHDGAVLLLNRAAEAMIGLSFDEVRGRPHGEVLQLVDEESGEPRPLRLVEALVHDSVTVLESGLQLRRRDGGRVSVSGSLAPFRHGGLRAGVLVLRDISERRLRDRYLALFEQIFHSIPEGIVITDSAGVIHDVNPAFERIIGYRRDEVLGADPVMFRSDHHDEAHYRGILDSLAAHDGWEGEVWVQGKGEEAFPCWLAVSAIRHGGGRVSHYVGVFRDISEFKDTQAHLTRLAHYDHLTGLPNRTVFRDRLHQQVAQARRRDESVAVMFLDLDRFKHINDTLGHRAGDELLKSVAERLRGCVREEDTVARLGGDEFTVLLGHLPSPHAAGLVAEKMIEALAAPLTLEGEEVAITTSIGIAQFPLDGADEEALIKAADQAMYHAKARGRNNYQFFRKGIDRSERERLQLEVELQLALQRDEFRLYFQPQVSLVDGRLQGVEALLRWEHPRRGTLTPADFLAVAEESGVIVPIGEWALGEACGWARACRERGLSPFRVAVNLSARQLREADFVERLEAILAESGMEPELLELEVNEGVVLRQLGEAGEVLRRLRALGVGITVDDFGTGYSSLSSLRGTLFDALKIDNSLVRRLDDDADDLAMSRAVIAVAEALRMAVIAEGVETVEQLEALKRQGCAEVQGYITGRPVPAAQFAADWEPPGR